MADLDVSMDAKRAWIHQVFGVDFGGTPSEPPDLRSRLNEIGLRVRELGPAGGQIASRFAAAVQALNGGRWQEAESILDEIEPLIAGGLSDARGQEAKRVVANARVWRDAVGGISGAIAQLKAAVMATLQAEDEHDPGELSEIETALDADLTAITDRLSTGLADQVDAVVGGDAERRKAAIPKIKARIDEVEKSLDGDEVISIIEQNGLQPISIAAPAKAALEELRKILDTSLS
jgi:hypothetical protein